MSFEPGIFVVGDILQDHPPFLPPFPASPFLHNVFTTATTPPVCALVHRLGLRPRVLRPANYSRHVQIITTFLAPFSLRRRNVSVEALKIGSNVLDEAFSVRGRFPLLLSLSLTPAVCVCVCVQYSGLEHFRCIYARMHSPIHRHSDRSRSLYRINYNVHGSRTRIAIRSIRVPEGVLFNYIYTARVMGAGLM